MTVEADAREGGLTTALRLMRLALPLLDRGHFDLAAARLQHAIDEAEMARGRRSG